MEKKIMLVNYWLSGRDSNEQLALLDKATV